VIFCNSCHDSIVVLCSFPFISKGEIKIDKIGAEQEL